MLGATGTAVAGGNGDKGNSANCVARSNGTVPLAGDGRHYSPLLLEE